MRANVVRANPDVDEVVAIQSIRRLVPDLLASPQNLREACEGIVEDQQVVVNKSAQL